MSLYALIINVRLRVTALMRINLLNQSSNITAETKFATQIPRKQKQTALYTIYDIDLSHC